MGSVLAVAAACEEVGGFNLSTASSALTATIGSDPKGIRSAAVREEAAGFKPATPSPTLAAASSSPNGIGDGGDHARRARWVEQRLAMLQSESLCKGMPVTDVPLEKEPRL